MQLSGSDDSWLLVAFLLSQATFQLSSPAFRQLPNYFSLPHLVPTVEAIHLGSLIAAQGYIFPISDHVLTMKDDGTFYRFQVGLPAPLAKNLFLSSPSDLLSLISTGITKKTFVWAICSSTQIILRSLEPTICWALYTCFLIYSEEKLLGGKYHPFYRWENWGAPRINGALSKSKRQPWFEYRSAW